MEASQSSSALGSWGASSSMIFRFFGLEAISETTALTGLTPSFNFSRPFFSRRRRARPPLDGSFGIAMDAPLGRSDRVLCLFENRRRGAR